MKKRITITESDRERILSLHTKYKNTLIKEQTATPQTTPAQPASTQPAATQPSVTERFKTAACPGKDTKKGQICKDQALQVQIKINDKCPSDKLPVKLLEDGVWGPKSTAAFTACGGSISGSSTAQTAVPQTPGTQAPLGAQDSTASNTTANGGSSETIDSLSV